MGVGGSENKEGKKNWMQKRNAERTLDARQLINESTIAKQPSGQAKSVNKKAESKDKQQSLDHTVKISCFFFTKECFEYKRGKAREPENRNDTSYSKATCKSGHGHNWRS